MGIILDGVGFGYKEQIALEDVSIRLDTPGVYVLAGANGSGKTTLLHMLYGLLSPSAGRVSLHIDGRPYTTKQISYVPDEDNLIQGLTGQEYLQFVADLYGLAVSGAGERISRLLNVFSLTEAAQRLIRGYSHGMRKKLQLCAGFLPESPIVMIDEPTNGLDPLAIDLAGQAIAAAAKKHIVIVATHDLPLAETIASKVFVINRSILAEGTPGQLRQRTNTNSLLEAYTALCGGAHTSGLMKELFA